MEFFFYGKGADRVILYHNKTMFFLFPPSACVKYSIICIGSAELKVGMFPKWYAGRNR